MKLETFKEKNTKRKAIIVSSVFIVLLISLMALVRSFALFETQQEYNVISGVVPKSSDITLAFLLEENGSKKVLQAIPEGKEYQVTVDCNKNAIGSWDYESWGPVIGNLSESLTRCQIIFTPAKYLENIIKEKIGSGVYEVNHSDAVIGSHMNATQTNNLKQIEYRYAGANPNNYIKFNDELWRIIGFVNTPEGSRVKLISHGSIGGYAWDSSDASINNGLGINEWSKADLMKLLNPGHESESIGGSLYWNKSSGNCYNAANNINTVCNFTNSGMSEDAKAKIDTITWNTGTNGVSDFRLGLTKHFYNYERSNNGKICTSGNGCNDVVTRTTTWKGKVGLVSVSDYGYATSGGLITNREACFNKELYEWNDSAVSDCKSNNWLYDSQVNQWTLISSASFTYADGMLNMNSGGQVYDSSTSFAFSVRPSIYLINNQKIIDGDGSQSNPYILN